MRVAVCQMNAGADDVEANVATAERLLHEAADGGAHLAALPEVFHYYGGAVRAREVAEPIPGPITDRLAAIARDRGMWVLGGSIGEREVDEGGHIYNLRVPELYRGLMVLGAEVLTVPSAFTAVTGEAHWEVLLRARAIEDQCFVVAPAQWGPWGPPEDGRRTYGNSMVVDPWGRVVAAAGDDEAIVRADLDLDLVARTRSQIPVLANRRPDALPPERPVRVVRRPA